MESNPDVTAIRIATSLLLSLLFIAPSSHAAVAGPGDGTSAAVEVVIDHEAGTRSPAGTLSLREGQRVRITVVRTRIDCFNLGQREERVSGGAADQAFDTVRRDSVSWVFDHDPSVATYIVEAKLKPDADPGCKRLMSEQNWPISVKTLGWSLAFAGAFVGDDLTDPVFFLEPGKNPSDSTQQGFLVRAKPEAEDEYELGTAAMIHLVHTDPERGRIRSLGDTKWAPVSFGLGINQGSDVRYLLGTSLQFGDQLYLSVGKVFGSRERLPDALLGPSAFTADSNALANLPTHTSDGWFLGVSYSFLGTSARSAFSQKFTTTPPAQATTQTGTAQGQGAQGSEVKLAFKQGTKFEVAEGENLELTLELAGNPPAAVAFQIKATDGTAKKGEDFNVTAPAQPSVEVDQRTVIFTIKAEEDDEAQGDRKFTLMIEGLPTSVKMDPKQFEITIKDDDDAS